MNTRARARADRKVRRTIEKQRRIEKKQRLESRKSLGTPYNLRSTMGRRGVNTSKGTRRGSKEEKTFDVSTVAPIVFFPVSEEDNQVDKGGSEVMFMGNHNEITLCAIVMVRVYDGDYETSFVVWGTLWAPLCCVICLASDCEMGLGWASGTRIDAET